MGLAAEDRLEILDLYARYARDFDAGDAEGSAAWFTSSGRFTYEGSGSFQGHAELAALFRRRHQAAPGIRHFVANVTVEPSPEGARGEAYVMVLRVGDDAGLRVVTIGEYSDVLVAAPEGWRLESRTFTAWLDPALIDAPLLPAV